MSRGPYFNCLDTRNTMIQNASKRQETNLAMLKNRSEETAWHFLICMLIKNKYPNKLKSKCNALLCGSPESARSRHEGPTGGWEGTGSIPRTTPEGRWKIGRRLSYIRPI